MLDSKVAEADANMYKSSFRLKEDNVPTVGIQMCVLKILSNSRVLCIYQIPMVKYFYCFFFVIDMNTNPTALCSHWDLGDPHDPSADGESHCG